MTERGFKTDLSENGLRRTDEHLILRTASQILDSVQDPVNHITNGREANFSPTALGLIMAVAQHSEAGITINNPLGLIRHTVEMVGKGKSGLSLTKDIVPKELYDALSEPYKKAIQNGGIIVDIFGRIFI